MDEINLANVIAEVRAVITEHKGARINIFLPKAWNKLTKIFGLKVYHETRRHVSVYVNNGTSLTFKREWVIPDAMHDEAITLFARELHGCLK